MKLLLNTQWPEHLLAPVREEFPQVDFVQANDERTIGACRQNPERLAEQRHFVGDGTAAGSLSLDEIGYYTNWQGTVYEALGFEYNPDSFLGNLIYAGFLAPVEAAHDSGAGIGSQPAIPVGLETLPCLSGDMASPIRPC